MVDAETIDAVSQINRLIYALEKWASHTKEYISEKLLMIYTKDGDTSEIKQPSIQHQYQSIYIPYQWTFQTYGRIFLIRSFFLYSNGNKPR